MKRVKRILTHKRHWVWYGLSITNIVTASLTQVTNPLTHPGLFMAISLLAGGVGLWLHVTTPKDGSDA